MEQTVEKAISAAIKKAKSVDYEIYIIYDIDGYDHCSMYQLDTFYAGIPDRDIIATVFNDGEVQF